ACSGVVETRIQRIVSGERHDAGDREEEEGKTDRAVHRIAQRAHHGQARICHRIGERHLACTRLVNAHRTAAAHLSPPSFSASLSSAAEIVTKSLTSATRR